MNATCFLKTRVSPETKRRVHALAERQFITESVWLKQAVASALQETARTTATQGGVKGGVAGGHDGTLQAVADNALTRRICIRLRPEDRLLLRERALARGMPAATYVSVLVRAHLRNLAPLPKEELLALKRSVAELGAIGRNLNQLTRAANRGSDVAGPTREDLRSILKVCEAMRNAVKDLIRTNVSAWEVGHAEGER